MRFCEFIELVKEEIEKLYGGEREIIVQDVLGNNGVERVGMSVKEQHEQKAPVIYLDSYYKSFLEQEMTVGNAVKDIYNTLNECQIPMLPDIVFSNFEAVKPRIVYRLVNYKHNKKLLEDIPYFIYYDLAIIFCVLIESNDNGCISMLIHNNYMNVWKTDRDRLYKLAEENTPRLLPFVFNSMPEIITKVSVHSEEHDFGDQLRDSLLDAQAHSPLYVLTNTEGIYGAAVVLYDGVLKEISETMGKDLIILPSSIHEVLLIPYNDTVNYIELSEMVKSINETEVPMDEVLSNNIYLYKRETNAVSAVFKESEMSKRKMHFKKENVEKSKESIAI